MPDYLSHRQNAVTTEPQNIAELNSCLETLADEFGLAWLEQPGSSALPKLAEEVLALTKVNWNTTQFDQKLPAPIKAAREVGRILKHIEYGVPTSPDFRKYT